MLMKNTKNRVIMKSYLQNHTVSGHTIYIEEITNQTATWEKHTSILYISNNLTWKFVSYLYVIVSVLYNLHAENGTFDMLKKHIFIVNMIQVIYITLRLCTALFVKVMWITQKKHFHMIIMTATFISFHDTIQYYVIKLSVVFSRYSGFFYQ